MQEATWTFRILAFLHEHWPQTLAGFAAITWLYKRVKANFENPLVRRDQILACEQRIKEHNTYLFSRLMEKESEDIKALHKRIDDHLNK